MKLFYFHFYFWLNVELTLGGLPTNFRVKTFLFSFWVNKRVCFISVLIHLKIEPWQICYFFKSKLNNRTSFIFSTQTIRKFRQELSPKFFFLLLFKSEWLKQKFDGTKKPKNGKVAKTSQKLTKLVNIIDKIVCTGE